MKFTETNHNNTYQAIWIAIGSFSSFALGIISAAVLSRYLDKNGYGTYRQILFVYNTLLVLFSAGLPKVFSVFLARNSITHGQDIVNKLTYILLIFGGIFSAFLFSFSGIIAEVLNNPDLKTGLRYFSPVPFLLLPTLGIEGIFSTYKKTIYIAIYSTLTRLINLIFIIAPVIIYRTNYIYAIYGWVVASVISLIIAYRFKGIPFKKIYNEKSQITIIEMLKYGLGLAIASLAGIAIKSSYQVYISRYFGTESFAEFSNGFIELPFVHMITNSISVVLLPVFAQLLNEQSEKTNLIPIWQNATKKSALIIYPLVTYFISFSTHIIVILFSNKYIDSSNYFIIAQVTNLFNIIVFIPLLLALGETKFYLKIHIIFALSSWIIGYLIVQVFKNPIAIAFFATIQSIILVMISIFHISKITQIPLISLFPVIMLLKILSHSLLAILIVKLLLVIIHINTSFQIILISFPIYLVVLYLTSSIFKINYFYILQPVIKKIK